VKPHFQKLREIMTTAIWNDVPINTTFPIHANVFQKGAETLIPVINNGSACPGKIWLAKEIKSAIWLSLNGREDKCVLKTGRESSIIHIPLVEDAGIVVCTNA